MNKPETLEAIRAKIGAAQDVRKILDLEEIEPDVFLYLIETPHSFPRFVVGSFCAECEQAEILCGCGAEWNARASFQEQRGKALAAV